MKRGGKLLVYLMSGFALSTGARAATPRDSGNPYHGIIERNVFNLKPARPPEPPAPPPPPIPKLTMTGIFTILGKKQVGLKVSVPAKAPEPAREDSYILTEGQMMGNIEVTSIDVAGGRVEVKNHGFPQSLNFTNDGAKYVAAPAVPAGAPGAPGARSNPAAGAVAPGANPGAPPPVRTIPRPMRLPQQQSQGVNAEAMRGMNTAGGTPAPGQLGFGGAQQPGTITSPLANSPAAHMSPEEQMIMIEVERERQKEAIAKGLMPALPTTPITQQQQVPQ